MGFADASAWLIARRNKNTAPYGTRADADTKHGAAAKQSCSSPCHAVSQGQPPLHTFKIYDLNASVLHF